jgi:hypothetical protein
MAQAEAPMAVTRFRAAIAALIVSNLVSKYFEAQAQSPY